MSENVESLDSFRPGPKTYPVSITFSGEAGVSFARLMADFKTTNPNDVVKRAIGLLLAARGKEIVLRDPETGDSEVIVV